MLAATVEDARWTPGSEEIVVDECITAPVLQIIQVEAKFLGGSRESPGCREEREKGGGKGVSEWKGKERE